ncbi:glycosyltransferase family 4 protein [Kineosporia sp. A_224]|uniref:glycosyltransferase family 4 protein n=1 Tax=Kineosporia sp. A_224 TaxID=1962180 RepID=UPI001E4D41AD|nr:glycosyltransferase family 4 protein [Kineosporia sp. A_224]
MSQARVLSTYGHDVRVCAASAPGDEPETGDGVELVTARATLLRGAPAPLFYSLAMARTTARLVKWSQVVHVSLARELVPLTALIVALAFRKKVILQPHGMLTVGRGRGAFIDAAIRPLARRAALVIALTAREQHQLEQWFRSKHPPIVVAGNPPLPGLSRSTADLSSTGCEVLFLGRLHPRKRVADFIAAASVVSTRNTRVNFSIVGPDGGDLSVALRGAESFDSISYEGAIPLSAVADRIARCSVFVLPSRDEPWGNTLVASLALGIPVVVAESAALSPLVREFSAGVIYRDEDTDALAQAIETVVADRTFYSQGARLLAAGPLSEETLSRQLIDAYSRVSAPLVEPHE